MSTRTASTTSISFLENTVTEALAYERVKNHTEQVIHRELPQLRSVSIKDYTHSLVVGIYCWDIAHAIGTDAKALLVAGLLHDIGKKTLPPELLSKKGTWTSEDRELMQHHVIAGYELLRGTLDFTAEVILRHHQRQEHPYPEVLPPLSQNFSQETTTLINFYAGLLAIADTYDAYHRPNGRNGNVPLTEENIREKMLAHHHDQQHLINNLYDKKILTPERPRYTKGYIVGS